MMYGEIIERMRGQNSGLRAEKESAPLECAARREFSVGYFRKCATMVANPKTGTAAA
jgi:hypothetical protein